MESTQALPRRALAAAPPLPLGPLAAFLVPAAAVTYLGLKGGGYDQIVQGEIGEVAWWLVLIGSLAGILPLSRLSRKGWTALALLTGFAVWMLISVGWAESETQGWVEVAHVITLIGLFVLLLAVQGRRSSPYIVSGVTAGIALIAGLALLSRLQPQLFPEDTVSEFLSPARARLHYPLNYWNALAAFVAIGMPLVWNFASGARTLVVRALSAAALPAMALTMFFTLSRGGAVAAIVGLFVFLLLAPNFTTRLVTLIIAGAGSAILIAGATQRSALQDGLGTAAARQQGDEMLAMVLIVCVGVALLQVAVALAQRHAVRPGFLESARVPRAAVMAMLLIPLAAFAVGGRHQIADRWEKFKNPEQGLAGREGRTAARFQSASGNGRYQYWSAAVRAGKNAPFKGIGAASFELWWKRHGTLPGSIRRAHSQVFQTFAELGIVGTLLLLGFYAFVLVSGALRALFGRGRALAAAATAGAAAFVVATSIDWVWEVTVVPAVFLALAAVALARPPSSREPRTAGRPLRLGVALAAVLAIAAIAVPLAGGSLLRDSQDQYNQGHLAEAYKDARDAQNIQSYAAAPLLQQALILERARLYRPAAAAARAASAKEPTNPGIWVVRSRIAAELGEPAASVAAWRKVKELNPRSTLVLRLKGR